MKKKIFLEKIIIKDPLLASQLNKGYFHDFYMRKALEIESN